MSPSDPTGASKGSAARSPRSPAKPSDSIVGVLPRLPVGSCRVRRRALGAAGRGHHLALLVRGTLLESFDSGPAAMGDPEEPAVRIALRTTGVVRVRRLGLPAAVSAGSSWG